MKVRKVVDLKKVKHYAEKWELDYELVSSLIWQESKGCLDAYRFELGFFTKRLVWRTRRQMSGYVPSYYEISRLSELAQRGSSYGPMQILGETGRSILGLRSVVLSSPIDGLYNEDVNLDLGCRYLSSLMRKHHRDVFRALREYNGSSKYPPLVLAHQKEGAWKKQIVERV